jgi:hypothetical protein
MSARSSHDRYGKQLLGSVLGKRWVAKLDERKSIDLDGVRADLDGIILSENLSDVECAVEIEATVYTQARSALLNLALHSAPKKLFVFILAQPQMGTSEKATRHFHYVWGKLAPICKAPFKLVVLRGTGAVPMTDVDRALIQDALSQLRVLST